MEEDIIQDQENQNPENNIKDDTEIDEENINIDNSEETKEDLNSNQEESLDENNKDQEKPVDPVPIEPSNSKNILEGIVPEPSREQIDEYYLPENLNKYKKEVETASKKVRNRDIDPKEYFIITNKYLDEIKKIENPKKQNNLIKELRTNFENSRINPIIYIGGLDVNNADNEIYKDFTKEILEYEDETRNVTVHFVNSKEEDLRYEFPSLLIHFTWLPFLLALFILKFILNYDKNKLINRRR